MHLERAAKKWCAGLDQELEGSHEDGSEGTGGDLLVNSWGGR
jgi:hypothetical protein